MAGACSTASSKPSQRSGRILDPFPRLRSSGGRTTGHSARAAYTAGMVAPSRELAGARRATRGFFLLCGIAAATWAPMVAFTKERLQLDKAQLGLVLVCLGIGSGGAVAPPRP